MEPKRRKLENTKAYYETQSFLMKSAKKNQPVNPETKVFNRGRRPKNKTSACNNERRCKE